MAEPPGSATTSVAVRERETAQRPALAETAVHPPLAVGGLLPEGGPHRSAREQMRAALGDPTWLTYLGVLVGAMLVTLILGILLVVT